MTDVETALQNLRGSVRYTREAVESLHSACETWLYEWARADSAYLRGPEYGIEPNDDEVTNSIIDTVIDGLI